MFNFKNIALKVKYTVRRKYFKSNYADSATELEPSIIVAGKVMSDTV